MASSPTKAVESLAMGGARGGTPSPDQAGLIAASGGGCVAPFQEEPFAAAVARLLADPVRAKRMGAAGRKQIRAHRSYDRLAEAVEAVTWRWGPPAEPRRAPALSGWGERIHE